MQEKFQLTSDHLKEASEHDLNSFTFIIDGRKYRCGRVQACFMSQKVCDLISIDDAVDAFILDINDPEHSFDDVISLMNGGVIDITSSNVDFLESVSRKLENPEIFSKIVEMRLNGSEINKSNVIDRLRLKHELNRNCDFEFSFLAEHFYEFKSSFL